MNKLARPAPAPTTSTLLETGIKPLDLFCPLTAGGTFGLFGIQGVGRIVLVEELMRRLSGRARVNLFYLVHRNEPDSVRDMLTKEKGYPGDAIGGLNVVWILNDIATDRDAAAESECFDASAFCTPLLGAQGLFPAIDPLAARSRLIAENRVAPAHAALLARLRDVLGQAKALMADPIMLEYIACRSIAKAHRRATTFTAQRLPELNAVDRLLVSRARKIERFLTTPFFVAEPFTKFPGHFVPLAQTVAGCSAILDGEYDDVPEESFLYIGAVQDVRKPKRASA
jgi:F0F1-type ATP synthase beta subunit